MIRYAVELSEIERLVDDLLPGTITKSGKPRKGGRKSWRDRARERTEQFRAAGTYNDPDGAEFWGEVKAVFAAVQGGKCAYCETCLAIRKTEAADGDVDHFRPKRNGNNLPAALRTGGPHAGYHLLSYHLGNYVLSCRTCNQDFKKAFFPIAGTRVTIGDTLADYAEEEPYLLYPLGTTDTDPETVLQFNGIVADPVDSKASNSRNYWRARITIDLFDLNGRDDLFRQRAEVIAGVYFALISSEPTAAEFVLAALSDAAAHANCARSFARLYKRDTDKAKALAKEAIALLLALPAI